MDAGTHVLLATYKPTRSSGRALKRSCKFGKIASSHTPRTRGCQSSRVSFNFVAGPFQNRWTSESYENHRLILQRTSRPRPSSMLPVFAIQFVDICAVTAEFFFRSARAFCANLTDQNCTLVLGLTVKTASPDRGALQVAKKDEGSEIGRLQTNEDCGPRELGR